MSAKGEIDSAIFDLAWSLWGEFGASSNYRGHSDCAVDLELLIAFTDHLQHEEPRLFGEAVQTQRALRGSIFQARLKRARRELDSPAVRTQTKVTGHAVSGPSPYLAMASNFQLRARAVFGVSARAEIIAALLLKSPNPMTSSALTADTLLAKSIVAQTASELQHVGVLNSEHERNRIQYTIADPFAMEALIGMLPPRAPNWARIFLLLLSAREAFSRHEETSLSLAVELQKLATQTHPAHRASLVGGTDAVSRARAVRSWINFVRDLVAGVSPELDTYVAPSSGREIDGLTGLLNRRAFLMRLSRLMRDPEFVAVLILDVDNFKAISDRHGYSVMHRLLKRIGDIVAFEVAKDNSGIAGRYGGEQFIVACHGDEEMGRELAERLKTLISSMDFSADGQRISVTVSIGVGVSDVFRSVADPRPILRVTDMALAGAKQGGQNRVELRFDY